MKPPESFIGQPIRALQTMIRTIAENDSEIESLIPDGIYGPETVRIVSGIQHRHGLPITGMTDLDTWETIVALYEPALIEQDQAQIIEVILNPRQVLRRGEAHPHLYIVQGMLAVLSDVYESVSAPGFSGILDTPTEDSIFTFQQLSGLPATGHLDKQTWKHLALQYPLAVNLQSLP